MDGYLWSRIRPKGTHWFLCTDWQFAYCSKKNLGKPDLLRKVSRGQKSWIHDRLYLVPTLPMGWGCPGSAHNLIGEVLIPRRAATGTGWHLARMISGQRLYVNFSVGTISQKGQRRKVIDKDGAPHPKEFEPPPRSP